MNYLEFINNYANDHVYRSPGKGNFHAKSLQTDPPFRMLLHNQIIGVAVDTFHFILCGITDKVAVGKESLSKMIELLLNKDEDQSLFIQFLWL